MTHYRVYTFAASGRIVSGSNLNADTDDQAIEACKILPNADGIELWQASRKVAFLKPSQAAERSNEMTIDPPRKI